MDGWMDGWMDRWTDGPVPRSRKPPQMDGWTARSWGAVPVAARRWSWLMHVEVISAALGCGLSEVLIEIDGEDVVYHTRMRWLVLARGREP